MQDNNILQKWNKNNSNWECVKILLYFTARILELSKVDQHWWHSRDRVSLVTWDLSKPLLWPQLLCSLGTKILSHQSLLWHKLQFTSIYYAAIFFFLRSKSRMKNIFNTAGFCQEMSLTKHKMFCPTFLSFEPSAEFLTGCGRAQNFPSNARGWVKRSLTFCEMELADWGHQTTGTTLIPGTPGQRATDL